MKTTILFTVIFLLTTTLIFAQYSNPKLTDRAYWDIGVEYGIDAGLGGNFGYTGLGVERWSISHGSVSILYRDDGIDLWGDFYEYIGEREFPEDVVDTGYSFITMSGLIGMKISKSVHILGTIGYREASFVQKRKDEFTILGRNGRYHTSYRDTDKSGMGVGAGVKFFIPMSNGMALTPSVVASTLTTVSISLGLAF